MLLGIRVYNAAMKKNASALLLWTSIGLLSLTSCGGNSSSGTSSTASNPGGSSQSSGFDSASFFKAFAAAGKTSFSQDAIGFTTPEMTAGMSLLSKKTGSSSTSSSAAALKQAAASSVSSEATYTSSSFSFDRVFFTALFNGMTSSETSALKAALTFPKEKEDGTRQGYLNIDASGVSTSARFTPNFYCNEGTAYIDISSLSVLRVALNTLVQGLTGDTTWLYPQNGLGYKDIDLSSLASSLPLADRLVSYSATLAERLDASYKTSPSAFSFSQGTVNQFVFSSTDKNVVTSLALTLVDPLFVTADPATKESYERAISSVLNLATWKKFSFGYTFDATGLLTQSIAIDGSFDTEAEKSQNPDESAYVQSLNCSTKLTYLSGAAASIAFPSNLNKTSYHEIPDIPHL